MDEGLTISSIRSSLKSREHGRIVLENFNPCCGEITRFDRAPIIKPGINGRK